MNKKTRCTIGPPGIEAPDFERNQRNPSPSAPLAEKEQRSLFPNIQSRPTTLGALPFTSTVMGPPPSPNNPAAGFGNFAMTSRFQRPSTIGSSYQSPYLNSVKTLSGMMEVLPRTEHGLRMNSQLRQALPTVPRDHSTIENPQHRSVPSGSEARSASDALRDSGRQKSPGRSSSIPEQQIEISERCDIDHLESDITTELRHLVREFQVLEELPNRINAVFQRFRGEFAERVRIFTKPKWFACA
jgi:hypothetical protein